MPVNQKEVYIYNHPDSKIGTHPFIVLSIKRANDREQTFIAVMITSSASTDNFSFPVTDAMFEKPLKKGGCQVRMHLIITAWDEDKGTHVNTMKEFYFNQMMKSIGDSVFNYDFTPL